MKLIQAMKQIKDLQRKADDLKAKVKQFCADMDFETPVYGSVPKQKEQIDQWIQAHTDIMKEILRLRLAIQKTNLETSVSINLGGKAVTKSIAGWIHRRRDLANNDLAMWSCLTDRGLKDGKTQSTSGQEVIMKVRRYYEPAIKDEMTELYRSEPMIIDSTLEVINAVTDLIED